MRIKEPKFKDVGTWRATSTKVHANGDQMSRGKENWRKLGGLLPLLVIAVLILASANLASPSSSTQASDPPRGIHLTWGRDDTAHTIVVTWKTTGAETGDLVLYDTQPRGENPDLYEHQAMGSHHTYSGAGGYFHDVELSGLSPDTTYYFICGGENGGWSEERSFRTAPEASTNIRFVAGGDSRSGGSWPGPRDEISRAMAKFNPSFALFTGDLVRQGDYQWEWDNWLAAAQEYWVDNDNLTIPIIPCIGNHELYGDGGASYYEQFYLPYLPSDEQWYSLNWGPDLHIIVLNSETGISGEQLEWLRSDLAAHKDYRWKIAIFHRPAFSGGRHGGHFGIQRYWVPLFDNYHVDLVLSGHDHTYERTYPINYTMSENTPMQSPENGTIYVVSGGWGAPLYSGSPHWWTAYGPEGKYHFVVVDIFENGTLHLQTVGTDGETFDEFFIHKEVPEGEGLPAAAIIIPIAVIACVVIIYLLKMRGTAKKVG